MLGLVGADVASQMTEWLSTRSTKVVLAVPASVKCPYQDPCRLGVTSCVCDFILLLPPQLAGGQSWVALSQS